MIRRMRRPPSKLVERLVSVSEEVLRPDRALRLEDVAALIGSARATLYYHFLAATTWSRSYWKAPARRRARQSSSLSHHPATSRPAALGDNRARRVPRAAPEYAPACSPRGSHRTARTLMVAKNAKLAAPLQKLR
jgi:hypothetical protein